MRTDNAFLNAITDPADEFPRNSEIFGTAGNIGGLFAGNFVCRSRYLSVRTAARIGVTGLRFI